MNLCVGLGNPGKKYANTRHNVGHMVINELGKENLNGFILAKTGAFMNESGGAIKRLTKNYKLQTKNLIIIHDDIDIPIGEFKISFGRGSAGHKGAQSIINELKTKDFWRIRVGICPKNLPAGRQGRKPVNVEKFVLQNFTKEEKKAIEGLIGRIAEEMGNWKKRQ